MKIHASALVAAVAVAVAIAPGAAQTTPQSPTFLSATDVVEVDVVALDKDGHFVTDLRADDFEVREEGQPQRVDMMYLAGGAPGASATPSVGATPEPGAPAATPERARPPRVFVALFDNRHLSNGGFKRVQAAALALFSKQFAAGDVGGVVSDGHLAHDRLTTDREELLADIRSARPGQQASTRKFDETQWPRLSTLEAIRILFYREEDVRSLAIRRACDDDPTLCIHAPELVAGKASQLVNEVQSDTARTMQTIAVLLRGLGRMEGRKTVLLLTEGFYADVSWPLVKTSIGEAARVNARIYTLDARGLDRSGMSEYLTGAFAGDNTLAVSTLKQFDYSDDAMNSLAVDTGGFVVRNQNYFDKAVAQIIAEASTYYVLGYRPSRAPDGKYRSISVKVKRPGVLIRARRGYVATPRPAAVATEARGAAPEETAPAAPEPARAPEPDPTPAPAPTPEAAPAEPVAAPATVTGATPASGLRFRPDAGKHVDLLLKDDAADAAAKAGWDAYQRGDVATARASLATAAADPSAHPWVHYALGLSQYALREFKESAAEWETVRRAEPAFEPVYFDLVDSYLQLHEHDEAIKVLHAARDRWPKDAEIFNALGVVQTSRFAVDDAVKSFQEAVTLAPNDGVGHYNLGRALEMRYNRTRRYVQQLRTWVSNEHDRTDAVEQYNRCIALGGAFVQQAQEGLARLNWAPKP